MKASVAGQNVIITLKSYDHKILDESIKKIVLAVSRVNASVCGPIPLPTHVKKYTVLRSPHVNKKSREQFEIRVHKRLLNIVNPSPQVIDILMKLEISSGVDVKIKV